MSDGNDYRHDGFVRDSNGNFEYNFLFDREALGYKRSSSDALTDSMLDGAGNVFKKVIGYKTPEQRAKEDKEFRLKMGIEYNEKGLDYMANDNWRMADKSWKIASFTYENQDAKENLKKYASEITKQYADDKEKFESDTKAAENGDPNAMFNLTVSYYEGFGVAKDSKKAIAWCHKAIEFGHEGAKQWLENYGEKKKENKAYLRTIFLGLIIGAVVFGVIPGFGFIRLILGAVLGLIFSLIIDQCEETYTKIIYSISTPICAIALSIISMNSSAGFQTGYLILGAGIGIGIAYLINRIVDKRMYG